MLMTMRMKRGNIKEDEAEKLEKILQLSLSPVAPRPAFVDDLKGKLLNSPAAKRTAFNVLQLSILTAAGLLSGVIIIATGIRATVTLLAALGLIRRIRERVRSEPTAHIRTA